MKALAFLLACMACSTYTPPPAKQPKADTAVAQPPDTSHKEKNDSSKAKGKGHDKEHKSHS